MNVPDGLSELEKALRLGELKLRQAKPPHLRLILMDADQDCALNLASGIREKHKSLIDIVPTSIVFSVTEFESWFLASRMSARHHKNLRQIIPDISDPDSVSDAKGRFRSEFMLPNLNYSETVDQPKFASAMPLGDARKYSRSFDKLTRDLNRLLGARP